MIVHAVRCDLDGCGRQAPLQATTERHPGGATTYTKPAGWIELDGRDFDRYACVAAYAEQKQRAWDAAHADPYEE